MVLKNLVETYKRKYHIPYPDLADAGESNRLVIHIASILLFIFSIVCISIYSFIYFHDFLNHKRTFFYYAIFLIFSIYGFIASKQGKDTDRSKSYIRNTIPFYVLMYVIFADAVFTVMVGATFNGFIVFVITAVIVVCTCSFSPLLFLLGMIISIACMTPFIIDVFGISGYINCLITVALMFWLSLYKRRAEKKHIQFLKKQRQNLEAKTFGNFTLIYENKVVKFTRTKSEELLPYLVYKQGSSVKTKELISILWGDHADSARYGSNLRNLIVDIKHTLGELQIQNFFIAEYNNFRINPEVIICDYYAFLAGDDKAIKSFSGEFMNQYSWAEEVTTFLERKVLK